MHISRSRFFVALSFIFSMGAFSMPNDIVTCEFSGPHKRSDGDIASVSGKLRIFAKLEGPARWEMEIENFFEDVQGIVKIGSSPYMFSEVDRYISDDDARVFAQLLPTLYPDLQLSGFERPLSSTWTLTLSLVPLYRMFVIKELMWKKQNLVYVYPMPSLDGFKGDSEEDPFRESEIPLWDAPNAPKRKGTSLRLLTYKDKEDKILLRLVGIQLDLFDEVVMFKCKDAPQ